jgi:rhamnogalacturonyl hydrolase YesR
VVENYLGRTLNTSAAMHYAEACTWYGALTTTRLINDTTLDNRLIQRFSPILQANSPVIPTRNHVDDRVFGILPIEIYIHNMDQRYLTIGRDLADRQWMTTTADGITNEARYWIDDMWMITALQVQAYRATNDVKYLDRAALTMASYLDRLQQSNGLFFHTMASPIFWGRGNGWFAAGMAELLRTLPTTHARYARILDGYRRMMAALRQYQMTNGMWRQVIDNNQAWAETSGTAMFTYAMVTGVKLGVLDEAMYGPAARAAWLQLITYLDAQANLREVCIGTGDAAGQGIPASNPTGQMQYYLDRGRNTGDFHGQAPVLWSASALLR